MRVTRHRYGVAGWGVGELWVRGEVLVLHELPEPGPWHSSGGSPHVVRPEGGLAGRGDERRSLRPLVDRRPSAPSTAGAARGRAANGAHPGGLRVARGAREPGGGAIPPEVTLSVEPTRESPGFVPDLCRRFTAHLEGERTDYDDVAVDLGWCTPFQVELARALRAVSWGEVVTYGELAALAGRPGAARAAGSFCAQGTCSLVLPFHRVVSADGIGGYGSSGVPLKRRLLALEGVRL